MLGHITVHHLKLHNLCSHYEQPISREVGLFQQRGTVVADYRRNWLLSACAYNTRQQENMRLTKSMRLTGSMRLIKSAKTQ